MTRAVVLYFQSRQLYNEDQIKLPILKCKICIHFSNNDFLKCKVLFSAQCVCAASKTSLLQFCTCDSSFSEAQKDKFKVSLAKIVYQNLFTLPFLFSVCSVPVKVLQFFLNPLVVFLVDIVDGQNE